MFRVILTVVIASLAIPASALDTAELRARQLASAGVYISMCPSLTFGEGLNSLGLNKDDIKPGGRYNTLMTQHAAMVKASTELAGTDPCARGLETYGPKGFAFRNLLKVK